MQPFNVYSPVVLMGLFLLHAMTASTAMFILYRNVRRAIALNAPIVSAIATIYMNEKA